MRLGVSSAVVDGALVPGDVEIADGAVAAVGLAGTGTGTAIPGLVDLQVNGFAGTDLLAADVDGVLAVGEALLRAGVTSFQPTLITSPLAELERALGVIASAASGGARIVGAHLEGPFLSPERAGTHPREHLRLPDVALLGRLLEAGPVTRVTLAPELPGAPLLIERLRAAGVVASLGHSDASAQEAAAAFDAGVTTVTHLFNAMRPLAGRDPGLAGAALVRGDVVVQIIADGVHLAAETVELVWRAAAGRVALVSDAIAAAGMGDGVYALGSVRVVVRDGVARREDGTLAGSAWPVIVGVRNLVALGVPLAAAVAAGSAVPAEVVGRHDLGRLAPGARADVVVLDEELGITRVLVEGRERVGPGEALAGAA
jgi:N-acetylglucosamine-6-phosphate deacetylase